MFDQPPRKHEALSWAYVALWSAIIFATVPFVRDWVNFVRVQWGGEAFTYSVTAIVVLVSAAVRTSCPPPVWRPRSNGLLKFLRGRQRIAERQRRGYGSLRHAGATVFAGRSSLGHSLHISVRRA